MRQIQSRDNPFYRELLKLASSARQRCTVGQTLLDGAHLLAECLKAGVMPQHLLLNAAALHDAEIVGLLKQIGDVDITQLDDKLFAGISELKTPTGILALIGIPQPAVTVAQSRFALLLEDIQDPGNLGSMLRSAAAAGCDAVFLSKHCADAWSPKVLRAAMGGHFALYIHECQNLHEVMQAFPGRVLATSLRAPCSLYECDLRGNVALLIGNEGAGLSEDLLRQATQTVTIPMHGKIESLNAAAAAAICLFEVARQRYGAGLDL
jgi:TrmH family RNA methyltransferase